MGDGEHDPRDIIEQRIAEGKIPRAEVEAARAYWKEHLRHPIPGGNEEWITITERDFEHIINERRIRKKPYRAELILSNVFEIITARDGRRMFFSQWSEDGVLLQGYAIVNLDSTVQTMHVVRPSEARRLRRQGDLLWTRKG